MRKSKSKGKELGFDVKFSHNKQKKSIREEHVISSEKDNPYRQKRSTFKGNKKKSDYRTSRNSLPVTHRASTFNSPKMNSPDIHSYMRYTQYQEPKLLKKRLTEYESQQHTATVKISGLKELCQKLRELDLRNAASSKRDLSGKIVKNIGRHNSQTHVKHFSCGNIEQPLNEEVSQQMKKSLARMCPMGKQARESPSSHGSRSRHHSRIKDSQYFLFD